MISAKDEFIFMRLEKGEKAALEDLLALYARSFYAFLCGLSGQDSPAVKKVLIESLVEILSRRAESEKPFRLRMLRTMISQQGSRLSGLKLSPEFSIRKPILEVLLKLDWEERLLILLRDQQELLYDEMRQVLEWPEERIKKRLCDARLHFRSQIEEIFRAKRKRSPA